MTTATQNLEADHVYILRLTEVMERITQSDDPNPEHLETIVKVIREFADGLHHAKEEQLLFPLLVQKGFSTEHGPVAVMLHEHQLGRNFVKGMTEGISKLKQGDSSAITDVYANMLGYTGLLKNHITKENNVLFPMADKAFSHAEQVSLLNDFEKVEKGCDAGSGKDDYKAMIASLEHFYRS